MVNPGLGSTRLTYTVPEAAQLLGVAISTVYAWVEHDQLPHLKVGHRVLIPVRSLETWISRRTQGGDHRQGATPSMPGSIAPITFPTAARRRGRTNLSEKGY